MTDDVRMKYDRYLLRYDDGLEIEVTKEEYIAAERAVGVHSKPGEENQPAAGSFRRSDRYGSVSGRVLSV